MSETPTDPAFAELKQRLQVSRGGNHPHIDWEDVFTIEPGRHSAAEHILQKVEQALSYLEKRDYGQELLRDIVLNEARTGRVTIKEAGPLGSSGSPASYNTDTDEIHFHYANLAKPNIRKKMAANEIKSYIDLILHEGGHAADIYGNVQYAEKKAALTSVEEKIRKSEVKLNESVESGWHRIDYIQFPGYLEALKQYSESAGCLETKAIRRANEHREESGRPLRQEAYVGDMEAILKKAEERAQSGQVDLNYVMGMSMKTMPQWFVNARVHAFESVSLNNQCGESKSVSATLAAADRFLEAKWEIYQEAGVEHADTLLEMLRSRMTTEQELPQDNSTKKPRSATSPDASLSAPGTPPVPEKKLLAR